jgi:recombination protein RecA
MELAMLRESLRKQAKASIVGESAGESFGANALAITPVSSGVAALDTALVLGGLPAGRVTEIAGPSSSGKTALGLRLLAEQTSAGKLVAFVDGTSQFYPPAAAAMGIDLQCTLLIAPFAQTKARRCTGNEDAVLALARAAEIITRSRAFSMVLIDLPRRARLDRTPARRLRVAAQATGATIIVLSSRSGDVDGAAARIETQGCQRNRTQLRIVKGAHAGSSAQGLIEFPCKQHRFDHSPPSEVAPILYRALPGQEVAGQETAELQDQA